MFNLDSFIASNVIQRDESMFLPDIEKNKHTLEKKIAGKTLLVIGGAGSIGSSFIKAMLPFRPEALVVVDTNENALAELTRDLRSTKDMFVPEKYITYPMDFASTVFKKMFRANKGFNIVANFSAHKHVRSEKDIFSIEALLRNNVLNIKQLLDLLTEFPPEEYFCVSTDKAANPVNIMGASKRIMEDVIFSYSDAFPVKTARFANVAFSNGSLPDGFLARMRKLQPLSAPFDVRRYFVSPEESGQICMLACMLGQNREIFFPKLQKSQMGSFDEIATKLLEVHKYEVLECGSDSEAIEKAEDLKRVVENIRYIIRFLIPLEKKAYEEFFTADEMTDMERLSALGVIIETPIPDKNKIAVLFDDLNALFEKTECDKEDVIKVMKMYLSNFEHIETKKTLDDKM